MQYFGSIRKAFRESASEKYEIRCFSGYHKERPYSTQELIRFDIICIRNGSNKLALLTLGFFLKEIPLRFLFYFYFFNFESYSKQHSPHSNDTV
jgi:hypothetical protein